MEISFNPDGTMEGIATKEVRDFLRKFGEISEFGDSDVKLLTKNDKYAVYEVYDEHGHDCSSCKNLTHNFILTKTADSENIMCLDCQPNAL